MTHRPDSLVFCELHVSGSIDKSWKEIATHILERNGAVSLSPMSLEDPQISTDMIFGSRLLGMDAKSMMLEIPSAASGRKLFETGSKMFVVMVHRNQRMEMTCTVHDRTRVQINANVQALVYKVSYPREARIVQRRAFFRAHVSAMPIKPLKLTPLVPNTTVPLHNLAFEAHLVNVSGGGVGVVVPKENSGTLKRCKKFVGKLELKMEKQVMQFKLDCIPLHHTAMRTGDLYVGMAFEITDPSEKRDIVDQLVKFTTWVQREQLRNKHQKT